MLALFPRVEGYPVCSTPGVKLFLASGCLAVDFGIRSLQAERAEGIEVIGVDNFGKQRISDCQASIFKEHIPKPWAPYSALVNHVDKLQHVPGCASDDDSCLPGLKPRLEDAHKVDDGDLLPAAWPAACLCRLGRKLQQHPSNKARISHLHKTQLSTL